MKIKAILSDLLKSIVIGLSINSIFIFIFANKYDMIPSPIIIKSTIAAAAIGVTSGLSSKIYDNENISLLASTVIHFLFTGAFATAMGFYAEWINGIGQIAGFLIIFTLIYMMIYAGIYFSSKNNINRINKAINDKKHK